jgi:hypothetical protein
MARVQVGDETWVAYRVALGTTPVSVGLGRLVEREVARHRRQTAADPDGIQDAVDDARAVAHELATMITRLERKVGPRAPRRDAESNVSRLFE